MRAGKLNKRVTIEEPERIKDSSGGVTTYWVPYLECWAEIMPVGSKESFASAEIQARASHKVRIRYRSGLDPTMRVMYGTRALKIEGIINPFERNEELLLFCSEDLT